MNKGKAKTNTISKTKSESIPSEATSEEAETIKIVYGYARENYPQLIPNDILRLISIFIDFNHHWYFKKKQLREMYIKSRNGYTFKSKLYVHDGITFQCKINVMSDRAYSYRYDQNSRTEALIKYKLQIIKLPNDIIEFGMYGELSCPEMNCKYRFPLKSPHSFDYAEWNDNTLKLGQLQKFTASDHVSFDVYIDIFYIIFKQSVDKKNYFRKLKIPRNVDYDWYIPNDKELGEHGIDSDSFGNDKWDLNLFKWGTLKLSPRLLFMPYNVSLIELAITVSSNQTEKVLNTYCQYKLNAGGWINVSEIIRSYKASSLCLKVKFEISSICDNDKNVIPSSEWDKYGFV